MRGGQYRGASKHRYLFPLIVRQTKDWYRYILKQIAKRDETGVAKCVSVRPSNQQERKNKRGLLQITSICPAIVAGSLYT